MAMKNIIDVIFVSQWEEGEVPSAALLNLNTGSVSDIAVSDEGENYEILVREYIRPMAGIIEADVEISHDGEYVIMSPGKLEDMRAYFNSLD